jgi:glycosyltransferase involved in cell wall biosynthesis
LVWHLTWGNAWLGSLVPFLPQRFVFGPVGGGTGAAWPLWNTLGVRGNVFEFERTLVRVAARYLNPVARFAWRRADLILAQNPETAGWFPARHRHKAVIFPHAAIEDVGRAVARGGSTRDRTPTAAFVGRLTPWKGVAIALYALQHLPDWRLIICGGGADAARLRRLAGKLGVAGRAWFLGPLPRQEVRDLVAEQADVLLFPSLHDDAPFAVVEALAVGVPVVCLDRGGPPVLGGIPVRASTRRATAVALAQAVRRTLGSTSAGFPDLAARSDVLRSIVEERLFRPGAEEDASRIGREAQAGQ